MQVISVNVGMPREVIWRGATVQTAIFTEPVQGQVRINRLNLTGDRQADLNVHGGAEKAVYAYPHEHYEFWRRELADDLSPGSFGENLTIAGLAENAVFVGDRLRVGSAVLTVTQPRMPCYKLGIRLQRDDIIKRFLASRRSGFYFSVEQEGDVAPGATLELLSRDPEGVTVTDIVDLFVAKTPDAARLQRALRVAALPASWKTALAARAEARG